MLILLALAPMFAALLLLPEIFASPWRLMEQQIKAIGPFNITAAQDAAKKASEQAEMVSRRYVQQITSRT